jgi:hypothetical protein
MGTPRHDDIHSPQYALKSDVFLLFRPGFDRLGRLRDISKAGVTVEFPVFEDYEKTPAVEVDIFISPNNDLMVRSLPCKVVYDVKVERLAFAGIEVRRCGLEFEQPISEQHSAMLQQLITRYAAPCLSAKG